MIIRILKNIAGMNAGAEGTPVVIGKLSIIYEYKIEPVVYGSL